MDALLIFAVVMLSPLAQQFLSIRLSEWLGRISFPLYLVHGPVMWIVGLRLAPLMESNAALSIVGGFVLVAVSIVVAIPFTWINDRAMRLARHLGELVVP